MVPGDNEGVGGDEKMTWAQIAFTWYAVGVVLCGVWIAMTRQRHPHDDMLDELMLTVVAGLLGPLGLLSVLKELRRK